MREPATAGIAPALLDLSVAPPGPGAPRRVLDGLVDSTSRLLGLPAGAALIDDAGAVHGVTAAAPDGLRDALAAGFGQGPGGDCARSGRPIHCDDLSTVRPRWLSFVAKASAAGVSGAWALPVRRDGDMFGALVLLGPSGTTRPDLGTAGSLAEAAAIAVRHARSLRLAEDETEHLRVALRSRVVIEQAKGALALHAGVGVDAAFDALRGHARRRGSPLAEIARGVVDGDLDPGAVLPPRERRAASGG
ncbi:ANTAR domain-containing protein [Pseudonocardia nantongensis]|uniref:ANTAR domain-containing protein n=1 Tax=Pseudonocardia nantongensis TaxID=1181885 RepID=UPI003978D2FD